MKLPIEIQPDPLVISTIEVRFVPQNEGINLLPLVYKHFQDLTPKLEPNKIPEPIRKSDPNLKYSPDFSLYNDEHKFSFSNCVFSFENVSKYTLWDNYFKFITKATNIFQSLEIISSIERVGVRYASIFNETNSVKAVFNFDQNIGLNGYEEKFEQFRVNLIKNDINFFVQLFGNAESKKAGEIKKGICIDIDASITNMNLTNAELLNTINRLHEEEKILFYSLLRKEFLDTLKPKY